MSAGAIGGTSSGTTTTSTSGAGAFGDISSEQFIKILVSELSNQDPFEPQDSGALLEQLSSLRNIESQLSLQKQLESLVMQNQVASASGMIGKTVTGLDDANNQVVGVVSSVRVQDGKAVLELNTGKLLAMDRVTEIANTTATN
jgi:flagellar basal-body rod modification protein FlgD